MKNVILSFYECEHNGDLEMYVEDVEISGGVIEDTHVDMLNETGTIECNISNDFWHKFKTTSAYEFLV